MNTLIGISIVLGVIALAIITPYLIGCLISFKNPFKINDFAEGTYFAGWIVIMIISTVATVGYVIGLEL